MESSIQRINVIGTSGSGKTTYAQRVAERLDIPHIELDALHWGPNWAESPDDEFRSKVEGAVKGEKWSIDGNYSRVRDIIWGRADTVVWLDLPCPPLDSLVSIEYLVLNANQEIPRGLLGGTRSERVEALQI